METALRLRGTLNAITDEHESLSNRYKQVFDALKAGPESCSSAVKLLDDLVDAVADHFQHEEEGGYYLHVVEKAPWRAPTVDELKNEHGEMMQMLVCIANAARNQAQSVESFGLLRRDFADFLKRCAEHEARENRLVQEVYLLDIAAAD